MGARKCWFCGGVVLKELAARIGTRVRGWRDKEIDRELRREAQEERIDKADKRVGLRNLACGAQVPAALRSLPATCVHQEKEGSNMVRFVGFIAVTVAFFTISSIAHAQYDVPALGTGTKTVEIVIEKRPKGRCSHRESSPRTAPGSSCGRRENSPLSA
jgi:hypothetical protein